MGSLSGNPNPVTCPTNQVPDRDNQTQEELKRSVLLRKVCAYKASTLSICDIIKYTQEDTICLPVWFVCLLICLLRKYREWMSKLVKNKEIPCCTSMWGLEMLRHVFIHVCTCVYLHVTYIGMGLPCGPTHIPVVSVYQCAV